MFRNSSVCLALCVRLFGARPQEGFTCLALWLADQRGLWKSSCSPQAKSYSKSGSDGFPAPWLGA